MAILTKSKQQKAESARIDALGLFENALVKVDASNKLAEEAIVEKSQQVEKLKEELSSLGELTQRNLIFKTNLERFMGLSTDKEFNLTKTGNDEKSPN